MLGVLHLESAIIVWAWTSASVKGFDSGVEVCTGVGERPTVPEIPEGQSVSTFLRSMIGEWRVNNTSPPLRFGRILADYADELITLRSLDVTSLAAFVEFHCLKNDYAV